MRVVVAHGPDADVRDRRQILHAAGVDCDNADCVQWRDLPLRLGQQDADLVLLFVDDSGDVPWDAIEDSAKLTTFPVFSVGENDANQKKANEAGAMRHIQEGRLQEEIDRLAERHRELRAQHPGNRRSLVLVQATLPEGLRGSGGPGALRALAPSNAPGRAVHGRSSHRGGLPGK